MVSYTNCLLTIEEANDSFYIRLSSTVQGWFTHQTKANVNAKVFLDHHHCSIQFKVGFNSRYWLHCHSNLRVSRTKIEDLRGQFGEDIKYITFRKFVTLLVQQLKKKCGHKNCVTKYWLSISLSTSFWTNGVTDFWRLPKWYLHQTVILDFQLLS